MIKSTIKFLSPGFILNFFSKGHERSVRAKRNILASFILKGISVAVYLALVPLTIRYVNATNYGIWLTLTSIIGWASFFDIGFGNGMRNRFTEAIARGDHELARIYVSTTYAILGIIITSVFGLFLLVNTWLDWSTILNADPGMASSLNILAIIVFAFFSMQFVFKLIATILTADQQPALAGLLQMSGNLLSLIIIFILMKLTEGNLIWLGFAMGGSPVLVLLVSNIWFFSKKYRGYSPAIKSVKFSYAKDLMSLGIQFFIIQISVIIILTTSNLIISQLFGPAEVAVYNVALRYFSVPISLFTMILIPFWSAFTEAWSKAEIGWIKRSMRGLLILWISTSGLTILMILIAAPVYRLWVGPEIRIPFGLTLFMGIYAIMFNWNNIFAYFLNGIGKIRVQLYISIFLSLITIPITVYLGKIFGINGVVSGTCLVFLINALVYPVQYVKIIRGNATGFWNK